MLARLADRLDCVAAGIMPRRERAAGGIGRGGRGRAIAKQREASAKNGQVDEAYAALNRDGRGRQDRKEYRR